ncbi:MAG: ATP-dependent sacrificial sulfur transferase LarE [Candidatus Nanopelagicales bacterium]
MTTALIGPLTGGPAILAGRVTQALGNPARLGVAFSGGVDSSVLLALAARALGPARTLAILGVSPSLASDERAAAHAVSAAIGVPLVELETHEGDKAEYRANGPDRCFHCKDELFTRISDEVADRYELSAIAYGENADDARRPDRPGALAATNHRVLRPLADAGLDKADVRTVARALGLASADKPAAPCLASRIPHFEEVTPEKLRQIDAAESAVRALGFADVRVRHHGEIARLELPVADLPRAVSAEIRRQLLLAVRAAGFRFVSLDLAGIQSGAFTLPLVGHG